MDSFLIHENLGNLKGEFKFELKHENGSIETYICKNVIVNTSATLIASLFASGTVAGGLKFLALGRGGAWDPLNPPAPTPDQTLLVNEVYRKPFYSLNYIKPNGLPITSQIEFNNIMMSGLPIHAIETVTYFSAAEITGNILEFGMFGGDADLSANSGTLINYLTFPINMPTTATLIVTFRLIIWE